MNTYNFDVNYTKGVVYGPNILLVSNDHNSTIFKFNFDQTGRHVFKLLYPDGTCYVQDIIDNQLILTKGILNQEGNYQFEVSLYKDDSRLTTARIKEFPVRLELVDTDSVVQPDDRVPILDNLIEETNKVVEAAKKGEFDGATFTPNVSENGDLSWTNDKGKENPPTVNIKGEPGEPGEPGAVKMQVVDTLPEVGETDTIYLLKKDTPGDDNYYDEYVYTTNSGWEHIGDTSVDLTDYYTKEETTAIIPPVLCLHEKNDSFNISRNMLLSDNLKQQFSDFVNKHPNQPFITYVFDQYHLSYCMTICYFDLTGGLRTNNERRFTQYMSTVGDKNDLLGQGEIFYSYNLDSNNVITFTKIALTLLDTRYATKTYVDDNKYTLPIASKETLGGVKIGDNLEIDENGVLSASSGSNLMTHHFSISNSLSNIFKSINNQIYIRDESIINNLINKLNEALNVGCQINLIVDFTDSSIRDIPVRLSFNPCNVLKASNSNKTLYFSSYISNSAYNNLSGYAECIIVEILMDCIFTNNVITSFQDNVFKISVTPIRLLPTNNTISYTPTSDYNPATKKYVDDAITAAITTSLEGSY